MFFFVLERGPPKFCKSGFGFERGPPDFCKSGFGSERWNPFDFPDLVFFGAGVFWFRTCFLAWMNLQPSAGRGMLFTLPSNRLGQFSPSQHSTILMLLIFCSKKSDLRQQRRAPVALRATDPLFFGLRLLGSRLGALSYIITLFCIPVIWNLLIHQYALPLAYHRSDASFRIYIDRSITGIY